MALGGLLYLGNVHSYFILFTLCCSLCLHYFVLDKNNELLPMHGKSVLITGCDTGFGHALAKVLSDRGVQVFAGVLDIAGSGAGELRKHGSALMQVLQLDITDHSQVERVFQYISAQVGEAGFWGLVNNAGIIEGLADGEILPLTAFRRCMDVNFLSAVKLCQLFLPLLRRSKGRIVNVTSMGGVVPFPLLSAYGASKAALGLFSRVLRLELAGWGVKVVVIQPAAFRTNIFKSCSSKQQDILLNLTSVAREDGPTFGRTYIFSLQDSLSKMSQHSSEDLDPVLNDMCHALMSATPKPVYTPGQMAWLLPFLYHFCPTVISDVFLGHLDYTTDSDPAGLK